MNLEPWSRKDEWEASETAPVYLLYQDGKLEATKKQYYILKDCKKQPYPQRLKSNREGGPYHNPIQFIIWPLLKNRMNHGG